MQCTPMNGKTSLLTMLLHPFSSLARWKNRLEVVLLRKEDGLITDQSCADHLHTHDYATIKQVHGSLVVAVNGPCHREQEADGLLTSTVNLAVGVRIADCQPILLWAPIQGVVGLVHAGWKGLSKGVVGAALKSMQNQWGISGGDLYACIGPCLCPACCTFSNPKEEPPGAPRACIHATTVDLRMWADRELLSWGIPTKNIERMSDCTRCMPETYWTYRGGDREAVQQGRNNMLACVLRK